MKKKSKVVKEDAIVAGDAAPTGEIQSTGNPASTLNAGFMKPGKISTKDVLGKCDHGKNGFMSKDCFHVPAKVKTPLKRWEIANSGSKRRRQKKYAYEQGMKVVTDLFEADMKMFDKQKIMKRLSKIASTVKSERDVKKAAITFDRKKNDVLDKMQDSKYAQTKQLFIDFGQFAKDVCTGKHKASWFAISMITVGLIYVFSPVDLIPDVVPVAGLIDDAFVIKMIYSAIEDEFNAWKINNRS